MRNEQEAGGSATETFPAKATPFEAGHAVVNPADIETALKECDKWRMTDEEVEELLQ